jgi:NifB/MoaA-like Fe-S oxidoreductase
VDRAYANELIDQVEGWQKKFRGDIGRAFIYPSDEFYIVAGREIPLAKDYDGFWQIENGVGIVRTFITEFRRQAKRLPRRITPRRKLTLATAILASGFMGDVIVPRLQGIPGLDVALETVPNLLYGRSVTVAGLLSGKCLYSALKEKDCGDLLLLPPDIVNADGLLLDDTTVAELERQLRVPTMVFEGSWADVFSRLSRGPGRVRLQ